MLDLKQGTLFNTRDLGGYVNKEGKRIRKQKLIRSGALNGASEEEIAYLKDELKLCKVIDLRGENEVKFKPNPLVDGVENLWLPIFEERKEANDDIQRDKRWDDNDPLGIYLYFYKMDLINGDFDHASFYNQFVTSEYTIKMYQKFFEEILKNEDGSILWHCSAGKDRTGMASVYLLKALGFDDELIKNDYLLSNQKYAFKNEEAVRIAKERGYGEELFSTIYAVNGVHEESLQRVYDLCDEMYGGMDNFLKEKLGLDDEKIAILKDLYLE